MTIGERIKYRRLQLGMSQQELAEKVGKKFEKTFAKFDKTNIYELDGFVYMEKDGKLPVIVGKSKNRRK